MNSENKSKPIERLRLSSTNRPIDTIQWWDRNGYMMLNAPYQRGNVWGIERRVNLIRSLLLGIPIPSIVINDRASAGWDDDHSCVVIDGKQRITTILMFLASDFGVPGEWFGLRGEVCFCDLGLPTQRRIKNTPMSFTEGQLPSLEAEIEVFNLVNYGGVPQGKSDAKKTSKKWRAM